MRAQKIRIIFGVRHYFKFLCLLLYISFTSCIQTKQLLTYSVGYQSIRTYHAQPTDNNPIPDNSKIVVLYYINSSGELSVVIHNKSSEIMTIDQEKSFFVTPSGTSISYYDPTVNFSSSTNSSYETSGISVNLGAITGILGIRGPLGMLANGISVGNSTTYGSSYTTAKYMINKPRESIAPNSFSAMSRTFHIDGIGKSSIPNQKCDFQGLSPENSNTKFKVCISYSTDGEKSFDTIITEFYMNSEIVIPVANYGLVNEALRTIYCDKTDALNEYWWLVATCSNRLNNGFSNGVLIDYK